MHVCMATCGQRRLLRISNGKQRAIEGIQRQKRDTSGLSMADVFEPFYLGRLGLKNRIIKAATHEASTFDEMERAYTRLARNDVALITVAYVAVSTEDKTFDNQHHIAQDNLGQWRSLCSKVHGAGSRMSAQLHHPGLFCMSRRGTPIGPSLFWLPSKFALPRVMADKDLDRVRNEFVSAAKLAFSAGIELHCGHGYLLSQFLSPLINRRSDQYGGSVEKRAAYPVSILQAIKQALPEGFPVVVKMNSADGFMGGLQLADAVSTAKCFAAAGADAIIPSFGFTSLNGFGMLRGNVPYNKMAEGVQGASKWMLKLFGRWIVPQMDFEPLFLREHSLEFVSALRGSMARIIYIGGADSLFNIQQVLQDGCVAVQVGRPLILEPFFVRRLMQAQNGNDVTSKCIRCVLASMDSQKFPAGCPFLKGDEGQDIEDIVSHL